MGVSIYDDIPCGAARKLGITECKCTPAKCKEIKDAEKATFERENRYLVLKRRDMANSLTELEQKILREIVTKVRLYREGTMLKPPLQCIVVESDWPEYEPTWKAIEQRVKA